MGPCLSPGSTETQGTRESLSQGASQPPLTQPTTTTGTWVGTARAGKSWKTRARDQSCAALLSCFWGDPRGSSLRSRSDHGYVILPGREHSAFRVLQSLRLALDTAFTPVWKLPRQWNSVASAQREECNLFLSVPFAHIFPGDSYKKMGLKELRCDKVRHNPTFSLPEHPLPLNLRTAG